MPSPFPGMDPWLEDPEIFPDLHDRFITHASEAIQCRLPPPYIAVIGRRAWIELSHRYIEPDVVLNPGNRPVRAGSNGGVAVAAGPTQAVLVRVPHDEHREPFVEIYAGRRKNKRLVTTIEVLSWANKTPGEHGRDLYVRKQREVLASKVHLVEIDLLRGGEHTTSVPFDHALAAVGFKFDYHICVHRFDNLEDYWVYPIRLPDRLPEVEVPLLNGDPPVRIDLQPVFDGCYDAGAYAREVRYRDDEPIPPLTKEQSTWALERLPKS